MYSGNAKIGHPVPNFHTVAIMPSGQFKDITPPDYKGRHIVFFFYPLDFTFVRPTETIAFRDRTEEFKKLTKSGHLVIAASVDYHFYHLAWINTPKKEEGLGPMNIPLVSDPRCSIAQDYGILKADEGISFRGLFIVDEKNILWQITVNDLPVSCSVDETLRLV
ncbi:peroxiredoxin-1-like [Vulpes lagopus]|uniref:peroxiredoxin-1-like n=1 Tax=Vulpes lagopus TaxID=494514 RepID=UPI001BC9EDC4|nr:peroxiredoxin-1-like [Vulpes lagopus]